METQYVGFGRRLVATLLDGLVIWAATIPVGLILGLFFAPSIVSNSPGLSSGDASAIANFTSATTGAALTGSIFNWIIWIGYVVFYQAKAGQTLGKKVMGIRVIDSTGKTPSMMTFFLRDVVGKAVSGIILLIGYFMVLWDSKKQGLHDKIAGTYVVRV